MDKITAQKNNNFTIIDNEILKDVSISLKAKAVHITVMSLPDTWDFSLKGLCSIVKEGLTAVRSAIDELRQAGYVEYKKEKNSKGQFVHNYIFYQSRSLRALITPESGFPHVENPLVENPRLEKTHTNKVLKNKKLNNQVLNNNPPYNPPSGEREEEVFPEAENVCIEEKTPPKQQTPKKNKQNGAACQDALQAFELVYAQYGAALNRNKRAEAEKIFCQKWREGKIPELARLLAKIDEYKNSLDPAKNNQYKSGIQVWIGQERWNDDFEPFLKVVPSGHTIDKAGNVVQINQLDTRKPEQSAKFSGRSYAI